MMEIDASTYEVIREYGSDILQSEGMQKEKELIQHWTTSVYEHSVQVTALCITLADRLGLKVDRRALIRGALLHDYFLYDWHQPDSDHRFHGFIHARRALDNAARDFELSEIERDMIARHMFPLNLTPPRYRESAILCLADKICATRETFAPDRIASLLLRYMPRA